jgi:hypothetical protein
MNEKSVLGEDVTYSNSTMAEPEPPRRRDDRAFSFLPCLR